MRSSGWCVATVLAMGFAVCFAGRLHAQAVNATLLGTVTDASGAVVPKAKVEVKEINTGISRSGETNDDGNYVFADLQPGQYQVSAEKKDFKKALHAAVNVLVNSTVRVDLKLEPGSVSEIVEVLAEAPILQTDRADIGRKIEIKEVGELPLGFNRNFQALLNLVPGTNRVHRDHSEFFNAQDSLAVEVNGQSRMANNLQIEGVDDNHRTGLLQVYIPPIEAIQTVDVTTSNYDAELGRAGGAVTNVMLKSGTNDLHGAAYEGNRVSALAAKNFFQTGPKAPSTYNYYGANIGGPIWKNKTFFFGDFVRISDHRGQFNTITVPTDAFRAGDFRAASTAVYDPLDPATGNPADPTSRQQICVRDSSRNCLPGTLNMIDPNRISPIARRILALVPTANLAGGSNNYTQNTKFIKNTTSFDVKVDHHVSQNDRLSGRYSFSNQSLNQVPIFGSAGGPANGAFAGTGTQRVYDTAVNYYHVFSPVLIAELRVGLDHYRNVAKNADTGTNASDTLGIRGVNLDDFTSGLTGMDISEGISNPMIGYSASLPWVRGETNINIVNNWTKTRGNHTLKWGVDIRRVRDDLVQAQTFSPRGIFRFRVGQTALNQGTTGSPRSSPTSVANSFASFLLDVPNEIGRDISVISGSYRETEFFSYAQDKWQITRKLTLDFGLRWELYPPAKPSAPGRFSNYDPTTNSLVLAGIGGNPLNLGRKSHHRDFAPRIGTSYRLTEKTVVRGGFGISYSPFPDNSYAFNFPVRQNNDFVAPAGPSSGFFQAVLPNGTFASMASGFPPPAPAAIPANGIIPVAGALVNQDYNVVSLDFREPYIESWNVAVQHSLPGKFVLETAYVGNHGVRVPTVSNLNAGLVPGLGDAGRPLAPNFRRNANLLFRGTSSNYHALQVKFDRKFSAGFLLTTAYTYSKALGFKTDLPGGGVGALNFYIGDFRKNYAPVEYDRRHTFVQCFIYELPFGKGKPYMTSGVGSWLLGGWQISGIWTLMSGMPLVFLADGTDLNTPGTNQVPNINGPFTTLGGIGPDQLWFDPTAFSQPRGAGVLGNGPRIAFSGPRVFNLDASLFRRFTLTERLGLEVRAEGFGVTNTPQFRNPETDRANADFGHLVATERSNNRGGARGSRVVALGAKLTF